MCVLYLPCRGFSEDPIEYVLCDYAVMYSVGDDAIIECCPRKIFLVEGDRHSRMIGAFFDNRLSRIPGWYEGGVCPEDTPD